jgi:hypothetical protein
VQPSDYPSLLRGELKAFFINHKGTFEATLISDNINSTEGTLWLVHKYTSKEKDDAIYGNLNVMVDVTPEKRYAIWNHKSQRFLTFEVHGYKNRQDAEIFMIEYCNKTDSDPENYYVVEWEIKDDVN